jgi:hypothetical protein
MKKSLLLLTSLGLGLIPGVQAVTVNVAYNAGAVNETTALTGFATTGAMMDGMKVSAFFSDGTSELVLWADTGASSGGVTGTGWSLGEGLEPRRSW